MIQAAQKKGKKILIGIDEVSKSEEMIKFASEYADGSEQGIRFILCVQACMKIYRN